MSQTFHESTTEYVTKYILEQHERYGLERKPGEIRARLGAINKIIVSRRRKREWIARNHDEVFKETFLHEAPGGFIEECSLIELQNEVFKSVKRQLRQRDLENGLKHINSYYSSSIARNIIKFMNIDFHDIYNIIKLQGQRYYDRRGCFSKEQNNLINKITVEDGCVRIDNFYLMKEGVEILAYTEDSNQKIFLENNLPDIFIVSMIGKQISQIINHEIFEESEVKIIDSYKNKNKDQIVIKVEADSVPLYWDNNQEIPQWLTMTKL